MNGSFRVLRVAGAEPVLYLTETALAAAGVRDPGVLAVAHGARRMQVAVVPILEPGRFLPVTAAAMAGLGLVEDVDYRLRRAGGELRIGPVIGILAASRTAELTGEGLNRAFLLRYADVGGLVFLFAADAVRPGAEWVEGLAWAPSHTAAADLTTDRHWLQAGWLSDRGLKTAAAEAPVATPHPRSGRFAEMAAAFLAATPKPQATQTAEGDFVRGRFPWPGAVWRRTGYLGDSELDLLLSRVGPGVFNARFFDKREGFRLLGQDPAVRPHLPGTEPYRDPAQVLAAIAADGGVILKRQEGNSGYGLMLLRGEGDGGYSLRYRERDVTESFASADALAERLRAVVGDQPYLLQQWIDLPDYQGRLLDFRVMLQKDGQGRWWVPALLGRFGRAGAVVTNFVNSGYALRADEALRRAFGVGHRTAFQLQEALIEFALSVGRALDATGGHYGDLGLDVALDRQRRIWLFEVNKLPFHELPLYAGQPQTYLEAKSGPLLYAAYLAGFGSGGA